MEEGERMRYICVLSRRIEEVYAPDVSVVPTMLKLGEKEKILGIFDEGFALRAFFEKGDLVIAQHRHPFGGEHGASDFMIEPSGLLRGHAFEYWKPDENCGYFILGCIHQLGREKA